MEQFESRAARRGSAGGRRDARVLSSRVERLEKRRVRVDRFRRPRDVRGVGVRGDTRRVRSRARQRGGDALHLVVRDATRRDGTDGTESTRQRRPREVRFGRVRVSDQGRRRAAPRWNARGSNLARRRRRREKNRPAGHRGDGGGGRGEVGIARGEVGIARGEVGKVRRDDVSGASVGGFRGENAARGREPSSRRFLRPRDAPPSARRDPRGVATRRR